jgi:LuxR family transcriptional regulator, activator of conjugal transfer of Ti plasmids
MAQRSALQSTAIQPAPAPDLPSDRQLVEFASRAQPGADGACAASRALEEMLRDMAREFGLPGGHYVHLGHAVRDLRDAAAVTPIRFIATSISDRRLYLDENGLAADPTPQRAARACTPFVFTVAAGANENARGDWLARRLRGRGVCSGVAIPVQDYACGPAYVSLHSVYNGEPEQLVARRGAELAYAAARFHEAVKTRLAPVTPAATRSALTAREIDCLRLAALGLTVAETALSLQVTPRTVEFHLKNAAEKFGASNKLRAVALAMSCGVIAL